MAANDRYNELTPKQRLFAETYFEISNGTKAAITAGYNEAGAHVEASRLLKNPKVKDYLAELVQERRERVQSRLSAMSVKATEILFELASTADSENVRMQAVKDIMDRSGHKPVERVDSKNELNGKIEFGFVDPNQE